MVHNNIRGKINFYPVVVWTRHNSFDELQELLCSHIHYINRKTQIIILLPWLRAQLNDL